MSSFKKSNLFFPLFFILLLLLQNSCSDRSEYGEASDYEKYGATATATVTTTVTTTATTQTNLDTWAIASYRSAHYQVSISDATSGAYQSTELMVLHNGSAASISQYGTVLTGSELATFATDIDSGSLRVRITPASVNSTVFKFKKTLIVV